MKQVVSILLNTFNKLLNNLNVNTFKHSPYDSKPFYLNMLIDASIIFKKYFKD